MANVAPVKLFERNFVANNGNKYLLKVTSAQPRHYDFDCLSINEKGYIQDAYKDVVNNLELPEYIKSMFNVINKIKKACSDNKLIDELTDFMAKTVE